MKKIKLTGGKHAIVDDCDYEKLITQKWHYNGGYAVGWANKKRTYMHRYIMNTPDGLFTDHINGDKLDNRRSNLRFCNHSQNQQNRHNFTTKSGQKGVTFHKKTNKWQAQIKLQDKSVYLGLFSSKEEAKKAYNKEALAKFGNFAYL